MPSPARRCRSLRACNARVCNSGRALPAVSHEHVDALVTRRKPRAALRAVLLTAVTLPNVRAATRRWRHPRALKDERWRVTPSRAYQRDEWRGACPRACADSLCACCFCETTQATARRAGERRETRVAPPWQHPHALCCSQWSSAPRALNTRGPRAPLRPLHKRAECETPLPARSRPGVVLRRALQATRTRDCAAPFASGQCLVRRLLQP